MGYIRRASGIPSFSRAVISIWSLTPEASIDAATEEYEAWLETDGFDGDLIGVIPLMTFGPNTETAFFSGDNVTGALSPCVIGVACNDAGAQMYARFQYDSGAPGYPIDFNDFFQVGTAVGPGVAYPGGGLPIAVTPNVWRHDLISFDFSGGCSSHYASPYPVFDTICPFYWAANGVNKTGNHLWPNTPSLYGYPAEQGIFSELCRALQDPEAPLPTFPSAYSFAAGNITTQSRPFAFPADPSRAAHIRNIVEARCQVFTGVLLDTSVDDNVRAFITTDGRPADPALARTLLGKSPEIEFCSRADWINGQNRGTAGNFSKTGTVRIYGNDP